MSERPIAVGDLVMVARNCDCDPTHGAGVIFIVERIVPAYNWSCKKDIHWFTQNEPLAYGLISKGDGHHPLPWLKRIPPMSELESTEETMKETA